MVNDIRIADMRIHQIAIADPPIRSSYGLHQPYALRTIIEFESTDGVIGLSETYGGDEPVKALEAVRNQIIGAKSKLKLLEAVLKMRNNLSELNCELRYEDDAYILDLANNPGLKILNVLQKFGPAVVKKFDLSNNTIKNIYPIENLNILELHFRNTGPFPLKYLTHYYEYLDAEGSKNDFSPFLENKPVKYLNIHNSLFTNYKVLTTLKNLETLIVSKGKLTEEIRSKLPKNCKVVEK